LKQKQCPIEQESKKEALSELLALAAVGLIEIFFGDESGFWQTPVIARAWQFRGNSSSAGKRQAIIGIWIAQSRL
jgi:hypothetical protein